MDYVQQHIMSNSTSQSCKHTSTKISLKMTPVETSWKIVYSLTGIILSPNEDNTSKNEPFSELVLTAAVFKG